MDDKQRELLRRIFGPPTDATDEPVEDDPPPSGHVPGEGNIPPPPRGDLTLREFAEALFNPPPPL